MESALHHLLDKLLNGELSEDERLKLLSLLEDESVSASFAQILDTQLASQDFALDLDLPETERKFLLQVLAKSGITPLDVREMPVEAPVALPATPPRVRFSRKWGWAAAAAILIAVSSYLYLSYDKTDQTLAGNNLQLQTEIAPGGDRALLTLADGRTITLDSASNGRLAQQGNAQVLKLANGEIVYNAEGGTESEIMWNTMSTPVGGQYQVTLPDGTKVWLNAASSITFPTAFTEKDRLVKITGEVYFEVVRNAAKPFKVDVAGKTQVEVLGTSFNINSYADEANISTTLINGKVKVIKGDEDVVLKPGQQASIATGGVQAEHAAGIVVKSDVDLSQTLAWKNGLFNFNGLSVRQVLNQLARWYDIKVVIQGKEPDFRFMGEMYRNVNLSDVLEMLKGMGVEYELKGKTLTVL